MCLLCRGSCGVYTIKHIEHLVFDGDMDLINDDYVQAYRERIAADLFAKQWTFV